MTTKDRIKEVPLERAAKLIACGLEFQGATKALESNFLYFRKLILDAYALSISSYKKMYESDDSTTYRAQNPEGAIKSSDMQRCERLANIDPKWATMAGWLSSNYGPLETHNFETKELQRWIDENKIDSKYQFIAEKVIKIDKGARWKSAEERSEFRWKFCEDRGLTMPTTTYEHYPKGISEAAEALGIRRQSLRQDLDLYRERTMTR